MFEQRWSLTATSLRYSRARGRTRRARAAAARGRRRAGGRRRRSSASLACGLCGSDVEKLGSAPAGTVLGHEVVAEIGRPPRRARPPPALRRVRALPRRPRVDVRVVPARARSGRAASPSGCATDGWVDLPDGTRRRARATMVEPLACVLRGAERVPHGRVLVVGHGFVGRLFAAVLARRGDEVFAIDRDPRRDGREPDGPVDAAILCAPGGAGGALDAAGAGRDAARLRRRRAARPAAVYRRELTVHGSRSATPIHMRRGRSRSCPSSTCRSRPSSRWSGSTRASTSTAAARL